MLTCVSDTTIKEIKMEKKMSLEHAVEAFAGFMVLLSVVLTYFVHPAFAWLTVFVGVNLFQQSFTGFCPAAIVLRKLFGFQACSQSPAS